MGLWLDNSEQAPARTAETVLGNLAAARVNP